MAWVDLSSAFAYGSKLTSTQMANLRDNVEHLRETGRNYIFLNTNLSGELSKTTATSPSTVATFRFYIPENAETLYFAFDMKVSDGTGTITALVTDDEAGTASGNDTTTDTSYEVGYIEVDCSSLSAGWGSLELQMHNSNLAHTTYSAGWSAQWKH